MSKTMLNIKMDAKLKKQLQKKAEVIGLPVSALMNNAARKIVAAESITFEAPLIPNAKTGRELKKAIAEIKAGKYKKWPSFKTGKEMIDYLHS